MLRYRSVLLTLEDLPAEATVDGPPLLRMEILNALVASNTLKDDIEGIECMSQTRWYIVFNTEAVRNQNIGKTIKLFDKEFTLAHPNPPRPKKPRFIHVRVFGYPLDSDRETLRKAMNYYGELSHINDLIDQRLNLKTGVKELVYTELGHEIPSFVYVGRHQVRTSYFGQTKTCRKCHQAGHFARDCTAGQVCKSCGEPGHEKANCPNVRCYHCHLTGHIETHCPKYLEDFPSITGNEETNNPTGDNPPQFNAASAQEWGSPDWGNPPVLNQNEDSSQIIPPETENPNPEDKTAQTNTEKPNASANIVDASINSAGTSASDSQDKETENTENSDNEDDDNDKTPMNTDAENNDEHENETDMNATTTRSKRGREKQDTPKKGGKTKVKRLRHAVVSTGKNRSPFMK